MSEVDDFDKWLDEISGDKPANVEPAVDKTEPTGEVVTIAGPNEEIESWHLDPKKAETYRAGLNVINAQAELDVITGALSTYDNREKELKAAIDLIRAEMQAKIDAMREEMHQIQVESYDLRKAYREATRNVEQLQRLFRQALDNELASERFVSEAIRFDELTNDLYWRKFAFEHQVEGAKYLAANNRVILGDKMGLGKSLTSLIACDMLQSQRVLIVVPDDVVSNFVHEVYKWSPHRTVMTLGKMSKAERASGLAVMKMLKSFVVVVNYSAWRKDNSLLDSLVDVRFDTIILDEAHIIKETTTNAYRGCKKLVLAENSCPECRGPISVHRYAGFKTDYRHHEQYFACDTNTCGWTQNRDIDSDTKRPAGSMRSAVNVFPMTGTAILNKPTDLFALLSLTAPETFVEKWKFEYDYCAKGIDGKVRFKPGGMNALVKRLSGKWLARDRHSAGVVLPKQEVIQHNIVLDETLYPKQVRIIKQLTKYAAIMLESGKQMSAIATIALITRKRQANVWPAGITVKDENGDVVFNAGDDVQESVKVDWCIDPNGEGNIPDFTADGNMDLGDRVVVFSQFRGPLEELEKRLNAAGISAARFDGSSPEKLKEEIRIDFDRSRCNEPGYVKKWQVVLANYKSGGVGLNFTDATQMVMLDSEWNGGKEDQAMGRVDRMGQTEETTVHMLNIDGTIDTWLRDLVESKRDMVDGFESTASLAQSLLAAIHNGELM